MLFEMNSTMSFGFPQNIQFAKNGVTGNTGPNNGTGKGFGRKNNGFGRQNGPGFDKRVKKGRKNDYQVARENRFQRQSQNQNQNEENNTNLPRPNRPNRKNNANRRFGPYVSLYSIHYCCMR